LEVQVTEIFLGCYRRTNNRAQIRNKLRILRTNMTESPNWLHGYEHVKNCALKTTFRETLGNGHRLIMNHKPPLRLLDFGPHDPTYSRWTLGQTSAAVQIQRADKLGETPEWLLAIFDPGRAA